MDVGAGSVWVEVGGDFPGGMQQLGTTAKTCCTAEKRECGVRKGEAFYEESIILVTKGVNLLLSFQYKVDLLGYKALDFLGNSND